jgi:lysozyme
VIRGIDVSHWQGDLSKEWWANAYKEGYRFAFLKATEGTIFIDGNYQENKDRAQEAGLKVGAYHFARPQYSGIAQAEHFINIAGELDIGGVWDLESDGGQSDTVVNRKSEDFLSVLNEHYGYSWMYSAAWFLNARRINPGVPYYRWVAHYTTAQSPYLPRIWGDYDAWQHSASATVAGKMPIDINRMKEDVFNKLVGEEQPTIYQMNIPANIRDFQIHIHKI